MSSKVISPNPISECSAMMPPLCIVCVFIVGVLPHVLFHWGSSACDVALPSDGTSFWSIDNAIYFIFLPGFIIFQLKHWKHCTSNLFFRSRAKETSSNLVYTPSPLLPVLLLCHVLLPICCIQHHHGLCSRQKGPLRWILRLTLFRLIWKHKGSRKRSPW